MRKIEQNTYLLKSSTPPLTYASCFKQRIKRYIKALQQLMQIGAQNMDSLTEKSSSQENGSENEVAKQEGKYLKTENPAHGRQLQNILPDVSPLLNKTETEDGH